MQSIKEEFSRYCEFKNYYDHDDPSHDWSHIERVVNLCHFLSQGENVNTSVLCAAAVLHDVVNVPKNSKKRSEASNLAANKAKRLLENKGFSEEDLNHIGQVIVEHSYSAKLPASSIESRILQDADKLDSMGAIGVMRWGSVGTLMKAKYYCSKDPFASQRELDDKRFSLDHFETKLLKLYGRLNTVKGKKEGEKRLEFMKQFLNQLKKELN